MQNIVYGAFIKTKAFYDWPTDAKFRVPQEVPEHFQETLGQRGGAASEAWDKLLANYEKEHPQLAAELNIMWSRGLPHDWDADLPKFETGSNHYLNFVLGAKGEEVSRRGE